MFVIVHCYHPSQLFASKAGVYVPANIRLGWKSLKVANTLAYYGAILILSVESIIVPAHGAKHVNYFRVCLITCLY